MPQASIDGAGGMVEKARQRGEIGSAFCSCHSCLSLCSKLKGCERLLRLKRAQTPTDMGGIASSTYTHGDPGSSHDGESYELVGVFSSQSSVLSEGVKRLLCPVSMLLPRIHTAAPSIATQSLRSCSAAQ